MAISSSMTWEVRSAGSATNSGGFNAAGSGAGTDFSQADTPQVTFTDLVIGAANTVTSVLFPFTAVHARNTLRITGGVNFTPGVYEITAVSGVTATLDRSPGTLAASGGAGKLGGGFAALADLAAVIVAGNQWWAKGAFSMNSILTFAPSGTVLLPITGQGYTSVRGDGGFATWTATGGGAQLRLAGVNTIYRNFKADGAGLVSPLRLNGAVHENCWAVNGTAFGIASDSASPSPPTVLRRCKASSCTTNGFLIDGNATLFACSATGNTGHGFQVTDGGVLTTGTLIGCLATGNGGSGFVYSDSGTETQIHLLNCTAAGNTGDGLKLTSALADATSSVWSCLFANNGGYGINSSVTDYSGQSQLARLFQNNAFYHNTLGALHQVSSGTGDVTLSLDPFTNAAGGDYSLNNATNAGGLLRFGGDASGIGLLDGAAEVTASAPDIGASQAGPATGAGGIGDPASLRSLWRELTNERSTVVIPDATIDLYLDGGLQALNRRIRYHVTDTATAITLVAGQQEYAFPLDCVYVGWIQWNGKEIQKADVDEWRRRDVDWRNVKGGVPTEWAHYRDKLVLLPPPDAAAVATNSALTIRYVSSPPSFSTNGAEQLALQDRRIPVYFGVAEWAGAHPDSALATIRAEEFLRKFTEESQAVAADYAARLVGR